jgi:hypothetical protein
MAYQMMKGKKGNNDDFPSIPGMIARYSASGLTNDQMATNPVWVDKTGNGHDLQMKNFAWAGMSGVGGYKYNFLSNDWGADVNQLSVVLSHKIVIINKRTSIQLFKWIRNELENTINITLKITGLEANGSSFKIYDNVGSSHAQKYKKDGIYQINYTATEGADRIYFYVPDGNMGQLENPITIEQLPLYPDALVFDGVDDYGVCENFPILTKEKGYTVVALRRWVEEKNDSTALVSNCKNWGQDGAFLFEYNNLRINFLNVAISFGHVSPVDRGKSPFSYQTSKLYNSKNIKPGSFIGSNELVVGKGNKDFPTFSNVAIWELVFLDHDATEEELTKIKDYFVKTYPWLFPDQAWTVVGKTNEDEDRATIANITGNGNDLILSNFGFAEGSGYGLYAYNFNSFDLRDNVVKPTDVKKDSFRIIGTGNSGNVLVLSNTSNSAAWKIRITGMKEGDSCIVGNANKSGDYIKIIKDGIYTFQKQYAATTVNGIWYNSSQEVDVLVEQIPEYEGYLITDGVDDKVTSVNAVTLNKDFTVIGEWRFKETEIRSNCGIVVERVLFVYNIPTGIHIYIHEVGGNFTELQNIKSLKAICSNGIVYDENWNPISVKVGSLEEYSNKLLLGYLSNLFTQIAFKNMSIYSNQVLSKDDCIKAYNYLQTLKAK